MTSATEAEAQNLWGRLRRRKVVQWGIAYAAGAWGLLQGLQFLAGAFDWPGHLLRLATVALALGLPIALTLAWYHGDRGVQRATRTEFAILTLLFLLGGGLFWRYQHTVTPSPAVAPEALANAAATLPAAAGPSIAVLPFENRSRVEDDAFFVDGIHDDILTQLSKVSALKVISRTSVERFRDTQLPVRDIAAQLGVTSILEGGVQRGGDRVRVTVQLIDVATDAHLWAETYDRELSAENIFAIQSEVAAAIAGALRTELTTGEQARVAAVPTQSMEAWESYQLGKQRMVRRSSDGLAEAEQFFRKAIKLDPQFALAQVGLADVLRLQIVYNGAPSDRTLALAENAVAAALRLQPELSEAWASAGGIAHDRLSFDDAEAKFRRAIEINPNNATARHWYSILLRDSGRLDESRQQIEQAISLDPLSPAMRHSLGNVQEAQGRFQQAADAYRKASSIDPLQPGSYLMLANLTGYALDRPVDAVRYVRKAIELDPGVPAATSLLAMLQGELGQRPEALRLSVEAVSRWPDFMWGHAMAAGLYASGGEWKPAVQSARRALALDPRDGTALYALAAADQVNGDIGAARARYANAYPDLLGTEAPQVDLNNYFNAVGLASILLQAGENARAQQLLDGSERVIRQLPRLSMSGYGIVDAQIHALRGDEARALAALREAANAGWRGPFWRFYRDYDPAFARIRNTVEFKAVFADIERDMQRQRTELGVQP